MGKLKQLVIVLVSVGYTDIDEQTTILQNIAERKHPFENYDYENDPHFILLEELLEVKNEKAKNHQG